MKNQPLKKEYKARGGARPGAGRKPFVPTEIERAQVSTMAGAGLPYEQIATLVRDGIDKVTLIKYFGRELKTGHARANAKIGLTIYQKAKSGDTTAMIWWSKTQMGWRETQRLEHTSPDGSMSPRPAIDATKLSDAAITKILKAIDNAATYEG